MVVARGNKRRDQYWTMVSTCVNMVKTVESDNSSTLWLNLLPHTPLTKSSLVIPMIVHTLHAGLLPAYFYFNLIESQETPQASQ